MVLLATVVHAADKAPTVDELINRAIASLENTSFEGRMRYSDPYGNGQEKLVDILFLSPSSFRVQPMLSEKQKAGYYYIENSDRLVKVYQDGAIVEELPERQFIIDNLMRRKLLETLAGKPNVSLLHGVFNGEPVYILRDEGSGAGSYSITIHVSERNDYPISLEMLGQDGERLQYYELEEVIFLTTAEVPDEAFSIPKGPYTTGGGVPDTVAPRIADVVIPERSRGASSTGEESQLAYKPSTAKMAQQAEADAEGELLNIPYPLLPTWLPKGYRLSAISPLDFSEAEQPLLVYQLELYNPFNEGVISIFETRSQELEELFMAGRGVGEERYFVSTSDDGWLVAVFGSISESQFDQIFESLERDDDEAHDLISRTMSKEKLRKWAQDVCTRDLDEVP